MRCNPIERHGKQFEHCSCACKNIPDIVIPHSLLREAARDGKSPAQIASQLGNPKRGFDAVKAASASMKRQGLITPEELPW